MDADRLSELVFRIAPLVLVGSSAVGGALAWWLQPTRRARRALARVSQKQLAAVADGDRVRVRGVARRADAVLTAPITGRACVAYRVVVEECARNQTTWQFSYRAEESLPFDLVSEGVEARVEGPFFLGLEVDAHSDREGDLEPDEREALERTGIIHYHVHDDRNRLRYEEAILEPGDSVWVLGDASAVVDPRGQREGFRDQPKRRVISGTEHHPVVLADADLPGLGSD